MPPGGASWQHYAYDQRNLMISHTLSVSGTNPQLQVKYTYDGGGNRVQQIDHTGSTPITTTYINDVVGLTQVLVADNGSTQTVNLFGLDLVGQDDGANFRTLLTDGLGSIRSEVSNDSVIATTMYDPFGNALDKQGTTGTNYGYTGEQFDSTTNLLYLRARYYNPNLHSFMGKDMWSGDGRRPQSMNGWSYVGNNPINLIDLTGETPFRADYCMTAFLPSEYAHCVRQEYGVKGFDFFSFEDPDEGFDFLGGSGCWYGPVPYRAPGYVEGLSTVAGAAIHGTSGSEVVYDFATMQRQSFTYRGGVLQDNGGVIASEYIGEVYGFRTSRFGWNSYTITDDYSEWFVFLSLGAGAGVVLGLELGPSIGAGVIFFASPTSPSIRGYAFYGSGGLSLDPVPILDVSAGVTFYKSPSNIITDYRQQGPFGGRTYVIESQLRNDILRGVDSPWRPGIPKHFGPVDVVVRHYFIMDEVQKYVTAFNQIHFDSYTEQ